jgi:hypothetical protein
MWSNNRRLLPVFVVLQLCSFAAQAVQIDVYVGEPPGVIKMVYPEYPAKLAPYAWSGKGLFLLKVNPKTGEVDEVKVLKTTGHVLLNELAAKAFSNGASGRAARRRFKARVNSTRTVFRAICINLSFEDKPQLDEPLKNWVEYPRAM